jgi:hypothetical protein
MKQFVKALDRSGPCFQYLNTKFLALSEAEVKEERVDGQQIIKLMKGAAFTNTMNDVERQALNVFTEVVRKFLGYVKDPRYKEIVENMLGKLRVLGCNMSWKLLFLHSHLEYFPENLGTFSEEQGERFCQDLKEMERRYEGRWGVNMMADYCWSIRLEDTSQEHSRTASIRTFTGKRYHGCSALHPNIRGNENRLFQIR